VISDKASQSSSIPLVVPVAVGVVVGAVLVVVVIIVAVCCCRRRTNEKHPNISSKFTSVSVVLFHQFV